MWDLPANTPIDYLQQDKINNPPIEQKLEKIPQISEKVWGVVFDVKNWVAKIIISWETKNKTNELNEQLKQELIEKLKKLPDYEWSKVQESIEKWTIEIKKIPWKELLAIYEKQEGNIIYLIKTNWEKYFNLDRVRKSVLRWILEIWYKKISWVEEKLENWIYNLYKWNIKIDISSDEYLLIILKSVDMTLNFEKDLDEEIKRREKLWIK